MLDFCVFTGFENAVSTIETDQSSLAYTYTKDLIGLSERSTQEAYLHSNNDNVVKQIQIYVNMTSQNSLKTLEKRLHSLRESSHQICIRY